MPVAAKAEPTKGPAGRGAGGAGGAGGGGGGFKFVSVASQFRVNMI